MKLAVLKNGVSLIQDFTILLYALGNKTFFSLGIILLIHSENGYYSLNPISPGGWICPPPSRDFPYNSITAQDIKMKFFKLNLIPMGVILPIMTNLINLRVLSWQPLLWMCCGIEK